MLKNVKFPEFSGFYIKLLFFGFYFGKIEKKMVKLYEFDEKMATIVQIENFLLQKLSQNGKKRKIPRIFRLLLKNCRYYGFYFGKIEKSMVKVYKFDGKLATIAQLENLLLQKLSLIGKKCKISEIIVNCKFQG